jgi:hypothetical protein
MKRLPRIAFDTSVINALEDSGSESEPLMKTLGCAFEVIVTATNLDKILSTKNPLRREALLSRCQRLLGRCILPTHWILELLIPEYFRDPAQFDWRRINVEAKIFERALVLRDFTDELCADQRKEQFLLIERFNQFWRDLRRKLDPYFAIEPQKRPTRFPQAAEIARMDDGVLWAIGAKLCEHEVGRTPSDAEVKAFMKACPQFLAACYGLCGAWYDESLKPLTDDMPAVGRNDLMMAVYLPYCRRFITHDFPQERRLREITVEAGIDCEILSYENFREGFLVTSCEVDQDI